MKKDYIDSLIFDLDGTLLDTIEDIKCSVNYVLSKRGYKTFTTDEYKNFIGKGSRFLLKSALGKDDEDLINEIYDEYLEYYLSHALDNTKSYRGIVSALRKANYLGYKIFILTNKPKELTDKIIAKIFNDIKFTGIISAAHNFKPKPDPESLLYIIKTYDLDPSSIIYFGDSDYDMIVCNKCGINHRIGCKYGYQDEKRLVESGASLTIDNGKMVADTFSKVGFNKGITLMVFFILTCLSIIVPSLYLELFEINALSTSLYLTLSFVGLIYLIFFSSLFFLNLYVPNIKLHYFLMSSLIFSLLLSYLFIPSSRHVFSFGDRMDLIVFIAALLFILIAAISFIYLIKDLIYKRKVL